MDPMPSGGSAHLGEDGADAAKLGAGSAAQGADFGGAGAVLPAGAAAAGKTCGRAGAGAEAAMETAAAVGHGGLAALAAAAGVGTATGAARKSPARLPFFSRPRRSEGRLRDARCESGRSTPCQAGDEVGESSWNRAHMANMFLGRYENINIATGPRFGQSGPVTVQGNLQPLSSLQTFEVGGRI
jgi:hypothetical protein